MTKILKKTSLIILLISSISVTLTACGTDADSGGMNSSTNAVNSIK